VAATRARRALHLLGSVAVEDERARAPVAGSLLKRLWPAIGGAFEEAAGVNTCPPPDAGGAAPRVPDGCLRRVPVDWCPPSPPPDLAMTVAHADSLADTLADFLAESAADRAGAAVEFDWAGETARHVGTVIHRALMEIARQGADAWDAARLARRRDAWRGMLASLGIPAPELPAALARVCESLERVVVDTRGRWLLDPGHQDARSELALSGVDGGELANVVIDRSFVDSDGIRWIVDYKSGRHEGGDNQAFLDREQQRYREQLERYARLMSLVDPRPIRLGLYFPALGGWREWPFRRTQAG
jgi:ATP-dependent helicase/nuclease subunit A